MSLSSLLKGSNPKQKEFQSIIKATIPDKKLFKTVSGKVAFSKTEYEPLVPYTLVKNYNSSIVGTSFDYLARIMLARVIKKNRNESYTNLTAEGGFIVLSRVLKNHPAIKTEIENKYIEAVNKLKAFSSNKEDIIGLIPDVCFLTKLEHIFRSGLPPTNVLEDSFFDSPDVEVIKDLESLCDVFQEKFIPSVISPTSEIIYNPNFGVASSFVGGADGDIIIDGTLYDFKSGKNIGYKWQEVAQILGYFLLNEISLDISNSDDNYFDDSYKHLEIERIAFYKARYGETEYIDLSNIDKQLVGSTKKKLATYFVKNPNFSSGIIKNLHILEDLAKA